MCFKGLNPDPNLSLEFTLENTYFRVVSIIRREIIIYFEYFFLLISLFVKRLLRFSISFYTLQQVHVTIFIKSVA